ncbi:MAG: hypothetical protein EAZ37_05760 [Burkholderiales bacterium]|nr:MAG: hypothetical protein EAZ37_05760 [Burkholderiales bacterium]
MTFQTYCEKITLWLTVGIFLSFPLALGLANVLMLLVVLGWLISGNYQSMGCKVVSSPAALSLIALFVLIVLGCFWGNVPIEDRLLHVAKYSKLVFAALLIGALGEPVWQRRCLSAFCLAMFFVMVSTWLNVWVRLPWSVTQTPGWGVTHHVIGDYITQNIMMAFFVLIVLASFWKKYQAPKTKARSIALLGLGCLVVLSSISITHLSVGRSGYVLLALAWVVTALVLLNGRKLLLAGLLILCLLSAMVASSPTMRDRFILGYSEITASQTDRSSSMGARSYIYITAPKMIADSPWIGHGTGSYHTAICRYVQPASFCPRINWHPENQYIAFATAQGLIGLFMYLGVLISLLLCAKKCADPAIKLLLFGITAFLMVNSLFNTPLFSSRESHFFMMMVALAVAMSYQTKAVSAYSTKDPLSFV